MNRFKSWPWSASVLALAAVLLAAEGGWLARERQRARRALAALEQGRQERSRFSRQTPALTREAELAVGRDLAAAPKTLAELLAILAGDGNVLASAPPPATALEAYFDLAAFVERTRQLALGAQVLLRPDEYFGFGSHRRQGPESGLVPAVFRQRLRLEYLLGALIDARPQALLAVQRERPRPDPGRPGATPAPASLGGPADDFFDLDARLSLRLPGRVEGDAFRLEFTGQTRALRLFLNRLAAAKAPFFVRDVQVEPLGLPADSATAPAGASSVPLVAQNFSRFAVVVEYLDLLPEVGKPAP